MRSQTTDATPWEVEAARRREIIESDFGVREPRRDEARTGGAVETGRRLVSWIAGIGGDLDTSSRRSEDVVTCRHGLDAPKAGI